MKKNYLSVILLGFFTIAAYAQAPTADGVHDQQTELIQNHSFEDEATPIRNRRFGPNGEGELFGGYLPAGVIPGWATLNNEDEASRIKITTEELKDTAQHKALCWEILQATRALPASIANVGFHGIKTVQGKEYILTFWARADKRYRGKILVGLQSKSDDTWHAQAKVKGKVKKRWKKYTIRFTADQSDTNARFVMVADKPGTLYLDCVSLSHM